MAHARTFSASHGPVTSELLVRLATLLNDFNPAHYDSSFATSVGLPGVIGPGTLIQAWLLADVEEHLEGPDADQQPDRPTTPAVPHTVRSIDLRLTSPFLVGEVVDITYELDGDTLTATATVAGDSAARTVATAVMLVAARG